MELRQLMYFYRTAQKLSFSDAARSMYVTQSTLSQQIKQLEDELGCQLFTRDSHKVVLTECGERLLPLAKTTLLDADLCKTQISDVNRLMTGVVNIGITHSFSNIFTYTMREFLSTYKGVKLNVIYTDSDTLLHMLRKRDIDFALAYRSEIPYDDVESYKLFEDSLNVVVRKEHPLAKKKSLTLADLKEQPLALPTKVVQCRKRLDKAIEKEKAKLLVRVELNDVTFLVKLVESSCMATILPLGAINHVDTLTAIPLEIDDTAMYGCLHVLKDVYKKKSTETFIEMLRNSPVVRLLQE